LLNNEAVPNQGENYEVDYTYSNRSTFRFRNHNVYCKSI